MRQDVKNIIVSEGYKYCYKCRIIKKIEEFNKNKAKRDGLFDWCKMCSREQGKNYYNSHREERLIYSKEYLSKPEVKQRKAEYGRNYRRLNSSRVNYNLREWRRKLKIKAFQKISSLDVPICVNCGCDNIRFLELNHVHGGGRQQFIKSGIYGHRFYGRILKEEYEISDYNILCRVCNHLDYLKRKFGDVPIKVIWEGK